MRHPAKLPARTTAATAGVHTPAENAGGRLCGQEPCKPGPDGQLRRKTAKPRAGPNSGPAWKPLTGGARDISQAHGRDLAARARVIGDVPVEGTERPGDVRADRQACDGGQ